MIRLTAALALSFVTLAGSSFLVQQAQAESRHGLSVFGELKYAPDFKHFDYVNPDAPKGGRMVTMGTSGASTFDS